MKQLLTAAFALSLMSGVAFGQVSEAEKMSQGTNDLGKKTKEYEWVNGVYSFDSEAGVSEGECAPKVMFGTIAKGNEVVGVNFYPGTSNEKVFFLAPVMGNSKLEISGSSSVGYPRVEDTPHGVGYSKEADGHCYSYHSNGRSMWRRATVGSCSGVSDYDVEVMLIEKISLVGTTPVIRITSEVGKINKKGEVEEKNSTCFYKHD